MTNGALILEAPYFVGMVVVERGAVVDAPPILRYMLGWTAERVLVVALAKDWTVTEIPDD